MDNWTRYGAPHGDSESLSQACLLRCSENTPSHSLTESRRVERNPASWIDRPPIAAKYACRRQWAEHEGSRFQAGTAALIRVAVFHASICFGAVEFQPKIPAQDKRVFDDL
jgi:hypothetical protein